MPSFLHCFAHASIHYFAKEVGLNSNRKHGTGRDSIQCRSSSCSAGFHPKDASNAFAVPLEDLHTALIAMLQAVQCCTKSKVNMDGVINYLIPLSR